MVLVGWLLIRFGVFDKAVSKALSRFVFRFLMPVMLFGLMSRTTDMPPVDWSVLIAFFGSCLVVFILGRITAKSLFHSDSTAQVILGMGGIFANNVQLGIPIIQTSLGDGAIPTASLLIVFNVLILWTAATACVEFGRTKGKIDVKHFSQAIFNTAKNPIVLGIITGTLYSFTGLPLPTVVDHSVGLIATATAPCALIVVGMGLAEHSFRESLSKGVVVSLFKLFIQPTLVFVLCKAIGVGSVETCVAVVMASLPCAINLYIMATEFDSEKGVASNAICLSTIVSSLTVPLVLTLLGIGY